MSAPDGTLPPNPQGRNLNPERHRAEATYAAHLNAEAAQGRAERLRKVELASLRYEVLADEYEYVCPVQGRRMARAGDLINISGNVGSDLVYGFLVEVTDEPAEEET
ncbi:hypothetical protein [Actinomadura sp. BRA 177]|uniref:hypothetical protein n=1 Tax=Actinomadura sp. BRA 177 TaxID=2745202 RepID=UPI00159584E1|nr:hypothetical protein [Actinomadura sp. BRA 177]NVI88674.1 hypothetical protein [Actinomadura sp. BRA 177]